MNTPPTKKVHIMEHNNNNVNLVGTGGIGNTSNQLKFISPQFMNSNRLKLSNDKF